MFFLYSFLLLFHYRIFFITFSLSYFLTLFFFFFFFFNINFFYFLKNIFFLKLSYLVIFTNDCFVKMVISLMQNFYGHFHHFSNSHIF